MDSLILDTRQAFRSFRHARGFSIVAVLSLSLGIAACTTIFRPLSSFTMKPSNVSVRFVKVTSDPPVSVNTWS